MSTGAIVFTVVVVFLIVYVINIYNSLVKLKNRFQNAFAQIEVQLKRRYDLIPNLVNTAKAYMKHESETLEAVINARNEAMAGLQAASSQPGGEQVMQKLAGAEKNLAGALGRMQVVMEAYPELKANQNMMQLSEQITSTENKVAFARQGYNDAVMGYNTYRQSFPPVFFAKQFGHSTDASLLEFADTAAIQEAPQVNF